MSVGTASEPPSEPVSDSLGRQSLPLKMKSWLLVFALLGLVVQDVVVTPEPGFRPVLLYPSNMKVRLSWAILHKVADDPTSERTSQSRVDPISRLDAAV